MRSRSRAIPGRSRADACNGAVNAGPYVAGDSWPPARFARLDHEHPASRLRQVRAGDEAVVTGADDDDVHL